MKCPECRSENPPTATFCADCGTRLPGEGEEESVGTRTLVAPHDELTTGSTFAGRYQIIEEIGKGGMGRIYKAYDTEIKEKIALKLIKPEISSDLKTIERFRNELRFARKIAHRNVSQMFDIGKAADVYYITMEYVPGEDLKSFIRRVGQMPVYKAVSIAKQMAEGLAEAHRLGVIHRDLKPSNIIIDREGNARIMDFGIARSLTSEGLTDRGVMIGTPEYMSPEQVDTLDIDVRSDIYSLGVIMFEMTTGRLPFEGETALSTALMQKMEKPSRPETLNPAIPRELSDLILKCLEKEREKRYASAEEIARELDPILGELPTTETQAPRRRPTVSKEITVTLGLKKILFPAIAVVLAVTAFFLVRILRGPALSMPVSDKPSLAVLYFKNNTGEASLNHWRSALTDLLITDLLQSKYLRVLSAEMLFNILRDLDHEEADVFPADILREVAERGQVEHVLVGNYNKAGDVFRINATLQEARSGEILGTESVEGIGEQSFYDLVDELTRRIKADFELSEELIAEDFDRNIEAITTSSPEALKLYSEGRKLHLQTDYTQSIGYMQKALKIDPDFAMAYRSVAAAQGNIGWRPAQRKSIAQAFALLDRVSERERYAIEGDYYRMSAKTYDKAISAYRRLLDLYPDDSIGLNNLGLIYFNQEEYYTAISLYEQNIRYNPESQLAPWNISETYMALGRYDRARETLNAYLKRKPDEDGLRMKIVESYLFEGDFDRCLSALGEIAARNPDYEAAQVAISRDIHLLRGDIARFEGELQKLPERNRTRRTRTAHLRLQQGRFDEAVELLSAPSVLYSELADVLLKAGRSEEAIEQYDKELRDATRNERLAWQIDVMHSQGLAYLVKGNFDEAARIAGEIKAQVDSAWIKRAVRYYHHLSGMIALRRGDFAAALPLLREAVKTLYSPEGNFRHIHALFFSSLGEAFYQIEDWERARQEYEKVIALGFARIREGDIYARSHYMLGKIFQQLGRPDEAEEYLRKFLEMWQEADPGLPEVEDARKRLQSLQDR